MAPLTCPPWCDKTTDGPHLIHEGATNFPGAAVAIEQFRDEPTTLTVWDQTETPYRGVQLGQQDALALARALSALDPEDLIRFAAALADGAKILSGQERR